MALLLWRFFPLLFMKNLLAFLLYCLSITAIVAQGSGSTRLQVLSGNSEETVIRLDLGDLRQHTVNTPKGEALLITCDMGTPLLVAGAPDLPKVGAALRIPATGEMAVEILGGEYADYPNVLIAPSKGDLKRNVDPASIPYAYGAEYERDRFWPESPVRLQKTFVMRNMRGQSVWLQPVQYNPVARVLRVWQSLEIRVYRAGEQGLNELPASARALPQSKHFEDLGKKLFLNARYFASRSGSGADMGKMLVLVKDELEEELNPLVEWKRQSGIHTTVVKLSEIGSSEASAVYDFVKNYYDAEGIAYLLIAGDETAFKPLMRPSGGTPYSCDNCFGYMEGDDHFPEVLVGRLHAKNPEQMRIMVNRNLDYEKTPLADADKNWCAAGLAACSNEGAGIGDDGQADYEQSNEWKAKHLDDGYELYWEFYEGNYGAISPTPGHFTADKPGNPVNTEIVQVMNDHGISLYNYTGHGWEQGLVSGNFNVQAVAQLRNIRRYPIIIGVACCAGNFTNNSGGDCLGEAVQRAGNPSTGEAWGSIAAFMSSDYQSWAPPMEGQDGMNQYLVDADGITLRPTIGAMAAYGNALMIAAYGPGGEAMADFWNPFTDPSTMPRTRLPQPIAAAHSSVMFLGASNMEVQSDVEGALVALYWEGQTLATAFVENGVASLTFPPLTAVGELTVTLTQFNYAPYQSEVSVTPASGPYVAQSAFAINDLALGNNNQRADYGETVSVDLTLNNLGVSAALATKVTLSADDDNVTLLVNEAIVGDIAAGEAINLPEAFTFKVSDDAPNGYVVNFTLDITFDGDQQSFDVPVKLYAPALAVGAYALNDAAPNGNNNKRFDGGETVYVTVKNANNGASISPDALATLTTDSPWMSIAGPVSLPAIAPGQAPADAVFAVTVSPDAPQAQKAQLFYAVQAGAYQAQKELGAFVINAIVEDYEKLNFASFPWQFSGDKPWVIALSGAYEGKYCSRSGSITHSQKSQMKLTLDVKEDSEVSFAYRVSSEPDYDLLRFSIDDSVQASWSGEVAWNVATFPVSKGTHTMMWSYEKDDIVSGGIDRAFVDEIFLPAFTESVAVNEADLIVSDCRVYPNPTADWVYVDFTLADEEALGVMVYDVHGRLIHQTALQTRRAGAHTLRFDLSAQTPGAYWIALHNANGVQKAVKVVR